MLFNIRMLVMYIFVMMITVSGFTQTKTQKIDGLMRLYEEYGQFNGVILVAENGEIIYKKGFGYANWEWELANTSDTKFRLASISKQFTAMLIMQLLQEGKIKLDGKLTAYLPYYRTDTGNQVTVHHLLTHTSGIPSYTNIPGFFKNLARDPYHPDSLIVKYCSGDFEFEPGTAYKYNNSGYVILGAIIEHVTAETYEQVLQKKIFDPLEMHSSGYDHHKSILSNRASGYDKDIFGFSNTDYLDMTIPYSAGALYSTIEDLYLWDQALYTDALLSQKYRDMMFTPFLNNYGYGWGIRQLPIGSSGDSTTAIAHSGGINGFNTYILRLVEDHHLIVGLANAPGKSLPEISQKLVAILYDQPYDEPKKSVADEIRAVIIEKDINAALDHYRKLKTLNADNYDFSEAEFNLLGYALAGANKFEEAVVIFKLNVEAFPGSANTYDSLAEGYMMAGKKKEAIIYYEKMLDRLDKDDSISSDFRERLRSGAQQKLTNLK